MAHFHAWRAPHPELGHAQRLQPVGESILQQLGRTTLASPGGWYTLWRWGEDVGQRTSFASRVEHAELVEKPPLQIVRPPFPFCLALGDGFLQRLQTTFGLRYLLFPTHLYPVQFSFLELAFARQFRFVGRPSAGIASCLGFGHQLLVVVHLLLCLKPKCRKSVLRLLQRWLSLQCGNLSVDASYHCLFLLEVAVLLQIVEHGGHEPRPVFAPTYLSAIGGQEPQLTRCRSFAHQHTEHLSRRHLRLPVVVALHTCRHLLSRQLAQRVRNIAERIVHLDRPFLRRGQRVKKAHRLQSYIFFLIHHHLAKEKTTKQGKKEAAAEQKC